MKKWLKGLGIGLLALSLAACGVEEGPKPENEDANASESIVKDEEVQAELTVEEVLEKAQASSEELESMHAKMAIKQRPLKK